jgi:hypothetical protein
MRHSFGLCPVFASCRAPEALPTAPAWDMCKAFNPELAASIFWRSIDTAAFPTRVPARSLRSMVTTGLVAFTVEFVFPGKVKR